MKTVATITRHLKLSILNPARLEVAMEAAITETVKIIQGHFETNQSNWKPLAASTIRERIRLGYGPAPILVREGTLRDEYSVEGHEITDGGHAGSVYSHNIIAVVQNAVRDFYTLTPEDQRAVRQVYRDALFKK